MPGNSGPEIAASAQSDHFHPLCAEGEVPYPTPTSGIVAPKILPYIPTTEETTATVTARVASRVSHKSRKLTRAARHNHNKAPRAKAARSSIGGYWYSWAEGYQNYIGGENVNGLWIRQSNEQPYIDYTHGVTGAHSLAQLWAIQNASSSCFSDVETGWTESDGQYNDVQPHLFMYAFDCGVGLGYVGQSSIPWVQSSKVVYPNAVLTHNDTWHTYGVHLYGSNWWFYYDGQWVGYIPSRAWTRSFPASVWTGEAGGEVATPEYSTCTDMGWNGRYGSDPEAAMFLEVWYEGNLGGGYSKYDSLSSYNSDPEYTTGNWYQGLPGWQFRYGGPGWC